jgi:hypothetical protein
MKYLVILLLFLRLECLAQDKKLSDKFSPNNQWYAGSLMLKNGAELKGMVKYREESGLINFSDGDENKTFTSMTVVAFEFFDESLGKQRMFYSFETLDPDSKRNRYFFFEVLKEFKTFAVLSRLTPIEQDLRTSPSGIGSNGMPTSMEVTGVKYSQTEFIYFLGSDNKLEPYLRIVEQEIDDNFWFDRNKTKNRFVDEDVFARFAGEDWQKIDAFAKEKNLSFKRKKDLLQIFDYYGTLLSN